VRGFVIFTNGLVSPSGGKAVSSFPAVFLSSDIAHTPQDTEMKELFAALLPEIADFYISRLKGKAEYDWGYEFLYNPEEACRKETKILLLTINPHAGEKPVFVDTPCPVKHALWSSEYKIKPQMLRLFKELKKIVEPFSEESDELFVSKHVIASSVVPFKTHSSREITPDMRMFSRYLWGRVFREW